VVLTTALSGQGLGGARDITPRRNTSPFVATFAEWKSRLNGPYHLLDFSLNDADVGTVASTTQRPGATIYWRIDPGIVHALGQIVGLTTSKGLAVAQAIRHNTNQATNYLLDSYRCVAAVERPDPGNRHRRGGQLGEPPMGGGCAGYPT